MADNKYKNIGTKVNIFTYEMLQRIAADKKMSVYEIMQIIADIIVRYMSGQYPVTDEMRRIITIFDDMEIWKSGRMNISDHNVEAAIASAVYLLQDKDRKKEGQCAVMVEKEPDGKCGQTMNVQYIFERIVEVLLPAVYRKLRRLAVDMECMSLTDLVNILADSHVDSIAGEVRLEFSDDARCENGLPLTYGEKTRRKPKRQ